MVCQIIQVRRSKILDSL